MPTFIDESGDTGIYGDGGGSAQFHLAAVWIPDHEAAGLFRDQVRLLRRRLGLSAGHEFKYATTHGHLDHRAAFFDVALDHPFRYAISTNDKRDPYWNCGSGSKHHWACATELAAVLRPVYLEAEAGMDRPLKEQVVVDDNGDRSYLAVVKRQFRALASRRFEGVGLVGKVSFRDSRPDEMIQLVDMVCGATAALAGGKDAGWHDRIRGRRL